MQNRWWIALHGRTERSIFAAMTKKASVASGWVVQVMTQGPNPEAAPSFTYFNVAIADADKAVAATAMHVSVAQQAHIRHVRQLSSGEIAALKLKAGQVKPA
jgi:hypothetical protein